jgi:hypothetical protein
MATDIQKKIILSAIVKALDGSSAITRTSLQRSMAAEYDEADFNAAFKFGADEDILEVKKHNYVNLKDDSFRVVEEDYYECVELMLRKHFKKRFAKGGTHILEKTARTNSKIVGRWTRPDFTVVSNRKFAYIKEVAFDIFTFEVKRPADSDTIAVFEALAHNTVATRSFVFFPITEDELDDSPQGERIKEECVRHGIGLMLVTCSYDLDQCVVLIDSPRRGLNAEKCSDFLQSVLKPPALAELTKW